MVITVDDEETVLFGGNHADTRKGRPPWTKPQIVTYSSRFVDKLSDVTGKILLRHEMALTLMSQTR
jgi:hypothetical protein